MNMEFCDELICLKSCYDASEFTSFICNKSHILKFTLSKSENVTFQIPESYPNKVPLISLSSSQLVKAEQRIIEDELRNFALTLVGSTMIMDLVIKLQELIEIKAHHSKLNTSDQITSDDQDIYKMTILQIDHMRQKNKYLKILCSWASELNINGSVILCHKWIFVILQGTKKQLKEFIIRLKTSSIDIDSSGKPCKEKMSKILFEEYRRKCFTSFTVEEQENVKCLETYIQHMNLEHIYKNVFKPIINS